MGDENWERWARTPGGRWMIARWRVNIALNRARVYIALPAYRWLQAISLIGTEDA